MSYLRKIEYRIEPKESFQVVRNCSGCGTKSNYVNTKRFRVNANGNKVDVWLIYQCEKCKHTFNLTVYERQNPKQIPKEEYQAFLDNDEELAEKYGKDFTFFAKNKAEISRDMLQYQYLDESGIPVGAEGIERRRGNLITIKNPYGLKVRVEKQVAELFGISRSQAKKMIDKQEMVINQTKEGVEILQDTKYEYRCDVKNNDKLRASFNELTRKTFCFDFEEWYQKGHWQDKYIPHVLVDNGKVISNVSVNLMEFLVDGEVRHYIQLGTVMTDENYRGQGLNRYIIEHILEEYKDKADGIYLFGNDNVLEYYPKFGFKEAKEYEYICCLSEKQIREKAQAYKIEKVDLSDANESSKLYEAIRQCNTNPNDGFYMCDNLGLYQFWLAAEYEQSVFYVPETEGYVIADVEGETLNVHQIFSKNSLDVFRFAGALDSVVKEIRLKYTPTDKEDFEVREFKEEDCTLFVIGEKLEQDLEKKMLFPVMSHA